MSFYEFDHDGNFVIDHGDNSIVLDHDAQQIVIKLLIRTHCPFCYAQISEEDMLCEQCLSRAREVRARRFYQA